MDLLLHPDAQEEWSQLSAAEYRAMANAFAKLAELGDQLGFPHTSNVQGAEYVRELRPRGGRSRWRAFFRRIGDRMAIGAIGPEARVDPRGFARSVERAEARLADAAVALGADPRMPVAERAHACVKLVDDIRVACGLPRKLSQAGVKREMIPQLVEKALADACHQSNPRPVTEVDFERLINEAF